MIKSAKNSIKAIIFVIIYVFFIFFISLFKGINLYNIKIPYIKTSHIFLKIDKKLIFKADNIDIFSSKNYQKSAFNLHKEFYLFSKILPFFQEINLKNIKYNEKIMFKNIKFYKNTIFINSNDLYLKGKFKLKYNVSYLNLNILRYKNYEFKNFSSIFYYTPNFIFANINAIYKNKPVYLALKIKNSNIYNSIFVSDLPIEYNDTKIILKNCKSRGYININNYNFSEKLICKKILLKNKFTAQLLNNKIKINNKNILLKTKKANIIYPPYKIYLSFLNLFYEFKPKILMLNAKKENINYKNYKFYSKNFTLNYNLKNKNLYLYTKNLKLNNEINFTSKELLIYKNDKTTFFLNKNILKNKYFTLKTKKINGNLKKIFITDIIGKLLDFNIFIQSPIINVKNKALKTNKIVINNINFNNNILKYSKNFFTFKTHTTTLLNHNIKQILKYFKINLPIIQKKGKNDIKISLSSNFKNLNIKYKVKSKKSLFKITDFSIPFFYNVLSIKGNKKKANIIVSDFLFPYQYLNSNIDANITVNFPKKYFNSFVYIKKLNVDKYLQIKNFHEKIVMDLIKKYIFLLNSSIFVNLNNKTIYFYDLKRLLKYSIFHEIFENGEAIIKLLNDKVAIFVNAKLNYPLILNQKNPRDIKANLLITKNNIQINTKNSNVKIKNLQKLMAYIKNTDIDVVGLVKIIKSIDKLINEINKNASASYNFKAVVQGNNTNFIYKNHKFITKKATFEYNKDFKFTAKYNKSTLKGFTKNGYLLIEGKHYNTKTLIPLLSFFKHFSKIDLNFILVRSPEDFYTGKIYINSGIVKDLKALNNIIAFVNTIPAILTLNTPGYSSKGYKIQKGYIDYILYDNILYFKQIKINGINLDFNGKGYVDLNLNIIKLKLNVTVKLKLKKIPIIGKALSYLLFGKDGYLHINIFVNGNVDNPKITKDLGFGIESPFILFKRALTLPFNIF